MKLKVTKMSPLRKLELECPEFAEKFKKELTVMHKKKIISSDITKICAMVYEAWRTGFEKGVFVESLHGGERE